METNNENIDNPDNKVDNMKDTLVDEEKPEPNPPKSIRYFLQHPYLRLLTAYGVIFCNFLMFAEDPIAHSYIEANTPIIGNAWTMVFTKYPDDVPNAIIKVAMAISGLAIGMVVGKFVIHKQLFSRFLRLKMFRKDQGSWMIMVLTTVLMLYFMSLFYNLTLKIHKDDYLYDRYIVDSNMGMTNDTFSRVAACCTWIGDFMTAWIVTDMMLQDRKYPQWAQRTREFWASRNGNTRIIIFWIFSGVSCSLVFFFIITDYIKWDHFNAESLSTNEFGRLSIATVILLLDISIVIQDWEFPHFIPCLDIKLPGVRSSTITVMVPKCMKFVDSFAIHITGKWFNYGILFIVMGLDITMWNNQAFYKPEDFGQYVDPSNRLYTITNVDQLERLNQSYQRSFDWRSSHIDPFTGDSYLHGDLLMNSVYSAVPAGIKVVTLVPVLVTFSLFFAAIGVWGRYTADQQKYEELSDD